MSERAIPIDGRSYQVDGRAVARRAIPDSEELHYHYDFSEYDTTTTSDIPDLSGNDRTLDEGSFTGYDTINGVQAADFNSGNNDRVGTGVDDLQPIEVFVIVEVDTSEGVIIDLLDVNAPDRHSIEIRSEGWYYNNDGGTDLDGKMEDGEQLASVQVGNDNLEGRVEDSSQGSNSLGTNAADGISLGGHDGGGGFFTGQIGEVLAYPPRSSSQRSDVWGYLNNKWSLGLSL